MGKAAFLKSKWFWFFVVYLAIMIPLSMKYEPDLSHVGKPPHKIHEFAGMELPMGGVNPETIKTTWAIMGFITILSFFIGRNLKRIPGRVQLVFETIIGSFDKIAQDTMGEKGRRFLPMVATLFILILLCNWAWLIPFEILPESTKDLNTPLALGIISFFVAHLAAIRYKGILKYIADYFEPWIQVGGIKIPNIIFAPLNIIGELGKLVSHSFRLYGNILGGVIIVQVVSELTHHVLLPIGLNLFFGLVVGAIQSFVFAMLALTYVAVLVEE